MVIKCFYKIIVLIFNVLESNVFERFFFFFNERWVALNVHTIKVSMSKECDEFASHKTRTPQHFFMI